MKCGTDPSWSVERTIHGVWNGPFMECGTDHSWSVERTIHGVERTIHGVWNGTFVECGTDHSWSVEWTIRGMWNGPFMECGTDHSWSGHPFSMKLAITFIVGSRIVLMRFSARRSFVAGNPFYSIDVCGYTIHNLNFLVSRSRTIRKCVGNDRQFTIRIALVIYCSPSY